MALGATVLWRQETYLCGTESGRSSWDGVAVAMTACGTEVHGGCPAEGCAFCVFLRGLVQLGADFCVHLRFPTDEITHKQMQNYGQIDPEYTNGIGTTVTTQLTYTVHSPHLA